KLLARLQFVGRSLLQLLNSELACAAQQGGGAAARQQSHGDADLLSQLGREAVAHVELLDLACFAGVNDFAVRPDAVDVGDDQTDVESARGHAPRMLAENGPKQALAILGRGKKVMRIFGAELLRRR